MYWPNEGDRTMPNVGRTKNSQKSWTSMDVPRKISMQTLVMTWHRTPVLRIAPYAAIV